MNLPISPTAVLGAVRIAGRLASSVRDAISFDDVLHEDGGGAAAKADAAPSSGAARPSSIAELTQQTIEAIREKLGAAGLAGNEPLQMRLNQDAELRIVGDHRQAAAIETLLASDPAVTSLAGRLHRTGGPRELTIPPNGSGPLRQPIAGGPA